MRLSACLLHSYGFWAAFSLVNFGYLGVLAFPFLLPVVAAKLSHLLPFLMVPGAVALAASAALVKAAANAFPSVRTMRHAAVIRVYLFHVLFLMIFLTVADMYKNAAIAVQLRDRQSDCVRVQPFFTSVRHAGAAFQFVEHALFTEKGKTYYWSYSTMRFFEGNARLDKNFTCTVQR